MQLRGTDNVGILDFTVKDIDYDGRELDMKKRLGMPPDVDACRLWGFSRGEESGCSRVLR